MTKYLFFDVSGTLLYKPELIFKISEILNSFGYSISNEELSFKHKLLSEIFDFPDRTDYFFYKKFNSAFLSLLGIVPDEKILENIFKKCSYLSWKKYSDTDFLKKIDMPMGIISNFNSSLKKKLNFFFGDIFSHVFVSEEIMLSKPDPEFYNFVIDSLNCKPNQILYVGDSIKLDIEPASKLGINTLLIDRQNFYSKNDFLISNLEEIKNYL